MLGAIIGDIAGSRFEFNNTHDYGFELFGDGCDFTDDTVCTVAVADAILRGISYRDSLLEWCGKYPNPMGSYGCSFSQWIRSKNPRPYNSFGNGAAMRVSPVGFAFGTPDETCFEAHKSASCSHDHPQGILGASAIAQTILLLRTKGWKGAARDMAVCVYGRDYESRLPAPGVFDETCQGCVPLALHLFDKSSGFEDAIRLAVSYGGDSDTLAAIVGGLAEAYYGVPDGLRERAMGYLPDEMKEVVNKFYERYGKDKA